MVQPWALYGVAALAGAAEPCTGRAWRRWGSRRPLAGTGLAELGSLHGGGSGGRAREVRGEGRLEQWAPGAFTRSRVVAIGADCWGEADLEGPEPLPPNDSRPSTAPCSDKAVPVASTIHRFGTKFRTALAPDFRPPNCEGPIDLGPESPPRLPRGLSANSPSPAEGRVSGEIQHVLRGNKKFQWVQQLFLSFTRFLPVSAPPDLLARHQPALLHCDRAYAHTFGRAATTKKALIPLGPDAKHPPSSHLGCPANKPERTRTSWTISGNTSSAISSTTRFAKLARSSLISVLCIGVAARRATTVP